MVWICLVTFIKYELYRPQKGFSSVVYLQELEVEKNGIN